jgi:drug/metabolite transporter (DMT)-like permease
MAGSRGGFAEPRVLLALLIIGSIWGFSFVLIKLVVREIGPWLLAFLRVWLAALSLLPVIIRRRRPLPLGPGKLRDLAFASLTNFALPYVLIPWGELFISTGQASILNATLPLFTVLMGMAVGMRPSGWTAAGVVTGFGGVVVLTGDVPRTAGTGWFLGAGAVLLAAFLYGVAAVFVQKRLLGYDALTLTFLTLTGSGLMLLPVALLTDPARILRMSAPALAAILALAVVCTAFCYLLYFFVIARAGATVAALNTYLFTAFALFWGWVFFREHLGWSTFGGAMLVFIGIGLVGKGRAREKGT